MGPNAKSVLGAIKRMNDLPGVTTIATGHGPLIQHNLEELVGRYQTWSNEKAKAAKNVAVFYVSEYGDADQLSGYLSNGILKTDVLVESFDLATTELSEIRHAVELANGIIIIMPPQGNDTLSIAISTIVAASNSKQSYGLCESGGGNDEPVATLRARFQEAGLNESFPPIKLTNGSGTAVYNLCEESGTDIGQWLTRDRAVQQMKSLDHDLDKALGRLSGGLYIVTAQKGDNRSAMLASWVSQASFKPLGLTIAVAKDRAIESLMRVGDSFVLNVLEENNYQPLMKHFLKRFAPGDDRFEGIDIQAAQNGSPILNDALAYLECEVKTRMDCGDHWLVYATVSIGRLAKSDSRTAVHHRKVGNHY